MDWRYNTIWFEQIEAQKKITWNFKENKSKIFLSDDIEYATLWYYKYKENAFELLPKSDNLLYLELIWANIKDFSSIEKFKNLKRLELSYCTKLETDFELSFINNSIEYLHINHSKKLQSIDEISKLNNLKGLRLSNCGPIENLDFLKHLPNLIDFRFVDTNVLDGDLSPLIEHPTIRSVGFFNKRHYNYSEKEIDIELALKSTEEFEDVVYKGQYSTFKHK